jgi:hypothetical protein
MDAKSIANKPNRQTRDAQLISKDANEFSMRLNITAKGGNKMAEVAKGVTSHKHLLAEQLFFIYF